MLCELRGDSGETLEKEFSLIYSSSGCYGSTAAMEGMTIPRRHVCLTSKFFQFMLNPQHKNI